MANPSDLRGEIRDFREQNTRVLNAMRQDMAGMRRDMADGFAEVRGRLDGTAAGLQVITEMLSTLIGGDGGEENGQ
jgi:uncharacterized protein (DUF885 family)